MFSQLAVRLRLGLPHPDFGSLTEAACGVTLARAIDRCSPGRLLDGDTIGYARSRAGGEVDFAPVPVATAAGNQLTTPIESKWVSDGWRGQARAIEARYGRGVLATKNLTSTGATAAWALPAPLLALLLG